MKAWIRRHSDETRDAWDAGDDAASEFLAAMTRAVSRANAFGWFCKANIFKSIYILFGIYTVYKPNLLYTIYTQ